MRGGSGTVGAVPDLPEQHADLGFDALVEKLREIVTRLESGKLSLDESLAAYEEGVGLARCSHDLLDRAEKRVELLVQPPTGEQGEVSEPFDSDDA